MKNLNVIIKTKEQLDKEADAFVNDVRLSVGSEERYITSPFDPYQLKNKT